MDEGIVEMLEYNQWATRTLIASCRGISDQALDARWAPASGSSRELFVHLVGAQQTFALRCRGRQHEGELNRASPWPGWEQLARLADQSSNELIDIARSSEPADVVDLPWQGKAYRYPVRFFLVHAVSHGVEHRTETKLVLAQQGIATPDLDAWQYAQARGHGAEVQP